ncbi:MAG: hypothetical protein NVSMB70_11260 [Chamaesiphon sp.]
MRNLQQSPSLKAVFKQQLDKKISTNRKSAQESLGGGFFGSIGGFVFDINQFSNQLKGSLGEGVVSLLLKSLPDSWVLFNNALIPTTKAGGLTEIDHLIIGSGGVFLVEGKTWQGSLTAYKDKWKRRDGNEWVPINNSPSSQSAYHQKMFSRWIIEQFPYLPDNFVTAPVVFTVAKWVKTTDCSVPVLHGISQLLQTLTTSPTRLTSTQILEIAEAVEDYTIPMPSAPIPKAPVPKTKPIIKPKLEM